ncbi:MAG: hypothetical protein AAGA96_16425 [Verrucomicrobiota bacterium]
MKLVHSSLFFHFFAFLLYSTVSLPTSAYSENSESLAVSDVTFEYGEPWIRQQPSSSMRVAQLLFDHEDDSLTDIEMAVFLMGGGTRANLDRWIGQFNPAPESQEETLTFGDRELVLFEATGTYMESAGGPFSGNQTPRENYTMLAAIIPTSQGTVFLKLTGPNDSVAAMKEAFLEFAKSPFKE